MRVVAGIVTFNPDIKRLKENIDAICIQVDKVILIDNGSGNSNDIHELVNRYESVSLEKLFVNKGIAFALNRVGEFAAKERADYFLTLDQDSVVMSGLIEAYKEYLSLPNIGMLNSIHKDRNIGYEHNFDKNVIEEDVLITSASFMPTRLFKEGYINDEAFFIDYVDYDLSLSLTQNGYKLYVIPFVGLLHELGDAKLKKIFSKKVYILNYSPFRLYYRYRNIFILWKKHGLNKVVKKYLVNNLKYILLVILFEKDKIKKLKAIGRGIRDGIKYKL